MSWTTLPDGLQMRRLAGELAARAARCRSFNGCFPRKKSKIWYMPRAQIRPCGGGTTWKGARQHSVRELLSRRVVPKFGPKIKLRRAVFERQRRALAVVVWGRCASDGPTVKVVGRLSGIDRIDAGVRGLPCTRLRRGLGLRPNRLLLDGDASTAAIRAK